MEATIPELGPVHFWSPKSSSFSGSYSIVVEEAAKNFQVQGPSVNSQALQIFLFSMIKYRILNFVATLKHSAAP